MFTAAMIRKHIFNLPQGVIFSTRELLIYGTRAAVDQTLYRLVNVGKIIRLARGLFIRFFHGMTLPSLTEIAKHKAKAFGRQIICHGRDAAKALGLVNSGKDKKGNIFAVSGRSSTFRAGDRVVRLEGTSPRKMVLGESKIGAMIRALWHAGKENLRENIEIATSELRHEERRQLRQSVGAMPDWIGCFAFSNLNYSNKTHFR